MEDGAQHNQSKTQAGVTVNVSDPLQDQTQSQTQLYDHKHILSQRSQYEKSWKQTFTM